MLIDAMIADKGKYKLPIVIIFLIFDLVWQENTDALFLYLIFPRNRATYQCFFIKRSTAKSTAYTF